MFVSRSIYPSIYPSIHNVCIYNIYIHIYIYIYIRSVNRGRSVGDDVRLLRGGPASLAPRQVDIFPYI